MEITAVSEATFASEPTHDVVNQINRVFSGEKGLVPPDSKSCYVLWQKIRRWPENYFEGFVKSFLRAKG